MLLGYARVSTQDQNPQLQFDALTDAGCEKIFVEKVSGAQRDRPELSAAIDYARAGDTLVVRRLDRLASAQTQTDDASGCSGSHCLACRTHESSVVVSALGSIGLSGRNCQVLSRSAVRSNVQFRQRSVHLACRDTEIGLDDQIHGAGVDLFIWRWIAVDRVVGRSGVGDRGTDTCGHQLGDDVSPTNTAQGDVEADTLVALLGEQILQDHLGSWRVDRPDHDLGIKANRAKHRMRPRATQTGTIGGADALRYDSAFDAQLVQSNDDVEGDLVRALFLGVLGQNE